MYSRAVARRKGPLPLREPNHPRRESHRRSSIIRGAIAAAEAAAAATAAQEAHITDTAFASWRGGRVGAPFAASLWHRSLRDSGAVVEPSVIIASERGAQYASTISSPTIWGCATECKGSRRY